MTRLLVVGANGQIGRELRRSLQPLGEVVAATRDGRLDDGRACAVADLSGPQSLVALVRDVAPSAVVNAAAYTAVDKAESDVEAAFRINAEAPAALAGACAAAGIPFVHYSTDYVFDGQGTRPYREDDPTAPLGVYGASKLAGEEAVRAAGGRHLIFRTAWVYAAHGHNFLRTMLRLGAEREELRVVADQTGTPTPAALIADVTTAALSQALGPEARTSGTWHLVATGDTSWHGFAEAIFAEAVAAGLLPRAPRVLPIATADYPTPARRPAYSQLDTTRLRNDFGIDPPHWRDGLHSVIAGMDRGI
ncbi:dTDP-4-dehydrorhamnose reductase [Pseudoxanthomonas suwonensis]|uniref:dTDP-4-dehydrorhamnose reductase n=1 Tax=Pseudoxanthomonas suwonensis TaxID=314722 RepID=A0A0E3Z2K5_9GAMM|nr:dTDP-4-dehydrorhamnose reductase [Pseudoxanthomonas suwonensis]AKC87447.1 dTDP-4-dehydrorhamnose reductase [Pseudoxanthomonas suwonensis]